jgi:hypothetical protein
MSERRTAARQKSFLKGCIYFNNRRSAFDCLVRDISAQGARLVFPDALSTPDVFDLYIPQKEQTLSARVTWRQGGEIGIAFANAAPAHDPANLPHPADAELAERVQKLEIEVAALRKMVKRLKADSAGPDVDAA